MVSVDPEVCLSPTGCVALSVLRGALGQRVVVVTDWKEWKIWLEVSTERAIGRRISGALEPLMYDEIREIRRGWE